MRASASIPSYRWALPRLGFAENRSTRLFSWAPPKPEIRSREFPSASIRENRCASGSIYALACALALAGCGSGGASGAPSGTDGGGDDATASGDAAAASHDADNVRDDGAPDASSDADGASDAARACATGDAGADAGCYAISCSVGGAHSLAANRDRLLADFAKRKCADACTLWGALSQAERYVFLMVTAYFGDKTSRLYPPGTGNLETALDHAVALYSINAPNGSDLGGMDYNRIYLGFDDFAKCVMRNFESANPAHDADYNMWVASDDLAGPHAPFTQREMIAWYRAFYDPQTQGPQLHHWHQDSDFTQSGIDERLGVCGNGDRSLVEATIAFDFTHNSDPLGDYSTRGGYGWQIVDQHVTVYADWAYAPAGCAATQPLNTDTYGGGSYNGMGPVMGDAGACVTWWIGDAGCH